MMRNIGHRKQLGDLMETQRDIFFNELFRLAKKDDRIIVISADMGAPSLDQWREELPDQFINVGIAEQNMIAIAAGIALSGKRPYCYVIASFLLRCYEFIKVDLCLMNLPVVIVGNGVGLGYSESGPTHHTTEDISIMRVLPNMRIASPRDDMVKSLARVYDSPVYIRLERNMARTPHVIETLPSGSKLYQYPLWLKPLDWRPHPKTVSITTVEEHLLAGGFGSIVAEYLVDHGLNIPLKRIGIDDEYFYKYGKREDIWNERHRSKG